MNHEDMKSGNPAGTLCINLRKLAVEEVDLLQQISRRTFSEAFGAGNDPENLRLFLESAYSRCQLAEELSDPDSAFWLLELDSLPAGYIMTHMKSTEESGTCLRGEMSASPEQFLHGEMSTAPEQPVSAKTIFELERIYILAAHQGKGYGKLLMGKAVAMAEEGGFRKIRLGVWQKNIKAVAFYQREGFRMAGVKAFLVGNDLQQDWVMEREVDSASKAVHV